jgi:hypothetical protein
VEYDFTLDRTKSVTLYEKWVNNEEVIDGNVAKLVDGKKFNSIIKSLAV